MVSEAPTGVKGLRGKILPGENAAASLQLGMDAGTAGGVLLVEPVHLL